MKFEIHQIHLTNEEYNKVNAEGHNSVPKHLAKIDMSFVDNIGDHAYKAWDKGYYTHVSNIYTIENNLNKVFEIGNIGPENNIERLSSMHSISVGDIIVQGPVKWVVADCGFEEVKEVA